MGYGPLTAKTRETQRHRTGEELRVWFNGEDVTEDCTYADADEGVIIRYRQDVNGRREANPFGLGPGRPEIAYGVVEIRPAAARIARRHV